MTINLILFDKVYQEHPSKYSKQQWEEHAIRAVFSYSKNTKKATRAPPGHHMANREHTSCPADHHCAPHAHAAKPLPLINHLRKISS
jgi:hypothetical protein